jgi:predicted small secreted protein
MSTPDYLFEDPSVNNQKFVCISVLTPKNFKEETKMHTMKVRGSYESYEEAKKRADFLRNIDPNVNVYVGEVGKWLPFDDDPENAKDHDYQNKRLNDMMKGYLENQEKAKEFHEQRKNEMILRSLKENEEKEKRRNERNERRTNGEVVDDDAEENAFYAKQKGESVPDVSVEQNTSVQSNESNITTQVKKEQLMKEKEREMQVKEKDIKLEREHLQKTQEDYNKYQQKTEKIRSELEEAKKVYEAMQAAGMKGYDKQ